MAEAFTRLGEVRAKTSKEDMAAVRRSFSAAVGAAGRTLGSAGRTLGADSGSGTGVSWGSGAVLPSGTGEGGRGAPSAKDWIFLLDICTPRVDLLRAILGEVNTAAAGVAGGRAARAKACIRGVIGAGGSNPLDACAGSL